MKTEENIAQIDGDFELSDDDNDIDQGFGVSQLDGCFDGFYRVSRSHMRSCYKEISCRSLKSCVTVLSDNAVSQSSVSVSTAAPANSSSGQQSVPNRQVKRDRSVSDDSNEGGDNPNKKKHQCHICNKLFPNSFRLKTHFRVHTGEKPFKCDPCNQAFADRSNYVKHKQTKSHKNKIDRLSSNQNSIVAVGSGHSLPSRVSTENSQEVPQFEFLDSPGTFNQLDLDTHVPTDGYGKLK